MELTPQEIAALKANFQRQRGNRPTTSDKWQAVLDWATRTKTTSPCADRARMGKSRRPGCEARRAADHRATQRDEERLIATGYCWRPTKVFRRHRNSRASHHDFSAKYDR